MTIGYADPPYLGLCGRYKHDHPDGRCWDDPETHRLLVARLCGEFPDGWAMSLSTPTLRAILPLCPEGVRVAAWVKPFCSFKVGVNPAYAWEPVIFRGGRKGDRKRRTVRDWVACNITLKRGLVGAKPEGFCLWLFDLMGLRPGDTFCDLFPGTGGVSDAWRKFSATPGGHRWTLTRSTTSSSPSAAGRPS